MTSLPIRQDMAVRIHKSDTILRAFYIIPRSKQRGIQTYKDPSTNLLQYRIIYPGTSLNRIPNAFAIPAP